MTVKERWKAIVPTNGMIMKIAVAAVLLAITFVLTQIPGSVDDLRESLEKESAKSAQAAKELGEKSAAAVKEVAKEIGELRGTLTAFMAVSEATNAARDKEAGALSTRLEKMDDRLRALETGK